VCGTFIVVFIPLLLLVLAVLTAGVVAYGTNAVWAQFPHGIEVIVWSRRLEWPLVTLCLILCLILLALIVSGKRRAWWLIGLGPVLALFVHRFVTDPAGGMTVLDNPTFVNSTDASFVTNDDYVVGLLFGDGAYAYPYANLFEDPVVLQSDHDKRLMLMWSPFANRAVAQAINREIKARDLEIVSMPANALLLYNRANGQFINGLKGQLTNGQKPIGFGTPVVLSTMTFRQWRELNPQTKVMRPDGRRFNSAQPPPHEPILPLNPMPPAILDYPANSSIILIGTTHPAAVKSDQVGPEPLRLDVDGESAFVFREAPGMPVKAFSCYLKKQGLLPRFHLDREHKYKGAMFVDSDTGSGWSAAGTWVGGLKEYRKELQGTRLTPVPVQDQLYWGVMKFWYPDLKLVGARQEEPAVTSGS
jgi:hypothetical protein